ncbi:alpha/beta fold hydrolase [Thalassotalea sp. PS06]|uniref:alpha/beta fold hydrolase n=1 Tax=Thalassotalea sp. PS06 TaxID=2594005 RepID=UPI0011651D25|nr:alpha/beta hydrolase [Thalassotalea sp. PS06]QDP01008.1 alpha/beta hydrolase [Thalassotalea sp. PS06]
MNPKPLLVFLPGTLCTGAIFSAYSNHSQYDSLIIEFSHEASLDEMANTVLSQVGDRAFIPVGFSMGGMVAFELIRQRPAQINGLILLNSNCLADSPERSNGRQHQLQLARDKGLQSLFQDIMLPVYFANPECEHAKLVVEMASALGIATFEAQLNVLAQRPDSLSVLSHFQKPSLVIGSEHDLPCPPEHQQVMASALPQGELHILNHCGHFALLEQADAIKNLINNWMARHYG